MDIEKILLDLEVIKQICENDKLSVNIIPGNIILSVDTTSYVSSITRWWNNYNRESSIDYLEKLIDNIEKSTTTIISGQHHETGDALKLAITNSITGLNNLKNTYLDDSLINSKIILCINKLNNNIILLDNFAAS